MAKGAYIGVNNVARKVKKGYIGIDGKARKIKKAYIGIGGVARPCWSGGELAYYGTLSSTITGGMQMSGASAGDYAIFDGGTEWDWTLLRAVAFSPTLTISYPTRWASTGFDNAATTLGNLAMFAGGKKYDEETDKYYSNINIWDGSLTASNSSLPATAYSLAATTVGNYAVFGGGYASSSYRSNVMALNASKTTTTMTALSTGRYQLAAATAGSVAIFAGGCGQSSGYGSNTVDAYNSSLTKLASVPSLQASKRQFTGLTFNGHAIFAGGVYSYTDDDGWLQSTTYNTVEAYNSSLTRTTLSNLYTGRADLTSVVFKNYGIIAGGTSNPTSVDVYDESFTKTTLAAEAIGDSAGAVAGNYALFPRADWDSGQVRAFTIA